jgi:hypothetical protein
MASRFRRSFTFREPARRASWPVFPPLPLGWQERPGCGQGMGPAWKAAPLCCAHQNRRGRWPRSIPPSTKARRQGAERGGGIEGVVVGGGGVRGGVGGRAKPCSRVASLFIILYYDGAGGKYASILSDGGPALLPSPSHSRSRISSQLVEQVARGGD